MSDLNILVGYDEGVVLELEGELDICSAPHVRSILDDVLAAHPSQLVLGMGNLDFMDSQGVVVLARALATTRRNGIRLIVRNPNRIVGSVLSVTGLSQRLECDPPIAPMALSSH